MSDPSPSVPPAKARATIVMTAKERHGLTLRTIESIVCNTAKPYRFIFADTRSPTWLSRILAERAQEWGLEVLRFDASLWQHALRRRVAPTIDTDYAVFLDNDMYLKPGWLERLVACADETGAGIVGPLYLWGADEHTSRIHMAGGRIEEVPAADGTTMLEAHVLVNRNAREFTAELQRKETDFAEYHCMLIRTSLLRDGALFDERIDRVHEHIDTSLTVRKAGHRIYLEPASQVVYLAYVRFLLHDIPFFRERWARPPAEANLRAFSAKWGVIDDGRAYGGVRRFLGEHRYNIDPIRPDTRPDGNTMQSADLRQTLAGLVDLANARRWVPPEWTIVDLAYRVALVLFNSLYRPCGRPFINHLVGTASVLAYYQFNAGIVAAGMLHAAYTHCPELPAGPQASLDQVYQALGGVGVLEQRVRAYTLRSARWKELLAAADLQREITVRDAEVLAIAAAGELDMHLSGEFRFSGSRNVEEPDNFHLMTQACEVLGVSALSRSLLAEREKLAGFPAPAEAHPRGSFRIVGSSMLPAIHNTAWRLLRQDAGSAGAMAPPTEAA
ncbi:MAG: glycosyltransferase [Nevskia sp.]|nr:glycosyltransferase [Nevskia sp.]